MKTLVSKKCNGDHTLFFQHSTLGGVIILVIYVDDIIITSTNKGATMRLEEHLDKHYEIKNLGALEYFFLGNVSSSI